MLLDLAIKNIAIIDTLHVTFQPGLNILTGETGAGKSIIIDAVNLILGGRASTELIRSGEDEAQVEALFSLTGSPEVAAALAESGLEADDELIVKRTVSRTGKNRVFLNGSLATTAQLATVAPRLINIYGQHESQTLLRLANHLELLDGYGRLAPLRAVYAECYAEQQQIVTELRSRDRDGQEAARRLDLLSFQSEEIAAVAPVPGEDEELERERELLAHADRLLQGTSGAFEQLYGADGALLSLLADVRRGLADCTVIDCRLIPLDTTLAEAALQIEDAALALRDYAARVDADPRRLQAVDDRLDVLRTLKKKYAPTIEEILALKTEIDRERESLLRREENREGLERRRDELAAELVRKGSELSARRREAAESLATAMTDQLRDLAMKDALILADFHSLDEPGPTGLERVEFLFSPNPGEPPRPLARIASGGELSRLMLALKQVHPESDVPTLIFDEVDTGIGGAVSALVGEKLRKVAGSQQVLCITHLPQVAVYADHHFQVRKQIEGGRTTTTVVTLDATSRIEEISRMLGGMTITETTRQHAREMLAGVKSEA
jgi:DNA repair protein RecN (Recombination protein N)